MLLPSLLQVFFPNCDKIRSSHHFILVSSKCNKKPTACQAVLCSTGNYIHSKSLSSPYICRIFQNCIRTPSHGEFHLTLTVSQFQGCGTDYSSSKFYFSVFQKGWGWFKCERSEVGRGRITPAALDEGTSTCGRSQTLAWPEATKDSSPPPSSVLSTGAKLSRLAECGLQELITAGVKHFPCLASWKPGPWRGHKGAHIFLSAEERTHNV